MKHGRAGPPAGPPPRTQAGHERRATIHDLPGHVLAHRVAAHLSAADAARLMQAAGPSRAGPSSAGPSKTLPWTVLKAAHKFKHGTFEDPITYARVAKKNGIALGQHGHVYSKASMRQWIAGKPPHQQTLPLTREVLTNAERRAVMHEDDVTKIIVNAMRRLIAEHRHTLDWHLPDGTRVSVRVYQSHPFLRGTIRRIKRGDTRTVLSFGYAILDTLRSPDVAEIWTAHDGRIVETPPEDRRMLLEVLRQLTGKRVVTTWVKDARYEYGIGSTSDAGRDHAREKRLVQDETKANPGAVVVLLTGHLER